MNIEEIKVGLRSGKLVRDGNKIYIRSAFDELVEAQQLAEFYDLKQMIRKLLLK